MVLVEEEVAAEALLEIVREQRESMIRPDLKERALVPALQIRLFKPQKHGPSPHIRLGPIGSGGGQEIEHNT